MNNILRNIAYIDNTNLYKGCNAEGYCLDYLKFYTYLRERWSVGTAYIFIGHIPENKHIYTYLQKIGYTLIFKETLLDNHGKIKGNCDAELVLQAIKDFYENTYKKALLVSSDGDFACLVKFLQEKEKLEIVLSPRNKNKCSVLIKKIAVKITFLPEVKNRIQKILKNEKPPLQTKL